MNDVVTIGYVLMVELDLGFLMFRRYPLYVWSLL